MHREAQCAVNDCYILKGQENRNQQTYQSQQQYIQQYTHKSTPVTVRKRHTHTHTYLGIRIHIYITSQWMWTTETRDWMGVNALLALGFCAIGMTQATYYSSLTTIEDTPHVVDIQSQSFLNLIASGSTAPRHLGGVGVVTRWLASNRDCDPLCSVHHEVIAVCHRCRTNHSQVESDSISVLLDARNLLDNSRHCIVP